MKTNNKITPKVEHKGLLDNIENYGNHPDIWAEVENRPDHDIRTISPLALENELVHAVDETGKIVFTYEEQNSKRHYGYKLIKSGMVSASFYIGDDNNKILPLNLAFNPLETFTLLLRPYFEIYKVKSRVSSVYNEYLKDIKSLEDFYYVTKLGEGIGKYRDYKKTYLTVDDANVFYVETFADYSEELIKKEYKPTRMRTGINTNETREGITYQKALEEGLIYSVKSNTYISPFKIKN